MKNREKDMGREYIADLRPLRDELLRELHSLRMELIKENENTEQTEPTEPEAE